jgi:hypothetical protein
LNSYKANTFKTILLFLLFITSFICVAQNKITIVGKTITSNNTILVNTSVLDIRTKNGTKTANNGYFTLTIPKQNTSIQFSYIGYNTYVKEITQKEIKKAKNDTIYLIAVLTQQTTNLTDFQVNADNIQLAYKEKHISIIDYDFHPKGLILLLSLNKEYKLRLVDNESNIISDLSIPKNPKKLFKDCLDESHILYKDSSFQIYETEKELRLMEGLNIGIFNRIMLPCVTSLLNNLFLESYGEHNKSIIYYSINKENPQKKWLATISDKESLITTKRYYKKAMIQSAKAVNLMGGHYWKANRRARDAHESRIFYRDILNKATYNPLFKIKDSIFIFDHVNDSVYVYDNELKIKRTFSIKYHYRKDWKKELITDYSNLEIYSQIVKSGKTSLLQINTFNGKIISEYNLERHNFINNIKIREGFAYYLFKDIYDRGIQRVYKQRLN